MTTVADAVVAQPIAPRRHRLHVARVAFRNWRHSRPFWAGVWTMLGGFLIAYVPATAFKFLLIANGSLIIGILVGAIVGFFGLMLWFARPLRVLLGVLILLLSLVSFFTSDFGGLLLGMLMGLIGGSLALAWVPTKTTWRQRRRARKLAKAGAPGTDTSADEPTATVAAAVEEPSAAAADEPVEAGLAEVLLAGDESASEAQARQRFGPRRISRSTAHPRGG